MAITRLTLDVVTDKPGIVEVRAKAAPGREMDARPVAGFYIRRRYEGDTFFINKPCEFSPRWMEFVDVSKVPQEWHAEISRTEEGRQALIKIAEAENRLTPRDLMLRDAAFSMKQLHEGMQHATINQATGKITPTDQQL